MIERLQETFFTRFGRPPALLVRAPGRVNLLGEHTDYNQGYVFPTAIDRAIYLGAHPRQDSLVNLYSLDFEQVETFSLSSFEKVSGEGTWSNYLRGVIRILQEEGHDLGGFDAVLVGDVPLGAGLSSSAALEVATATMLKALFDLPLSPKQLAIMAQRAENEFVGVQCGIMDPFVSALGEADHALCIDCRDLAYRAIPLALASRGVSIVIVNSGQRRGLVDSEFNARRGQCEEAVGQLSAILGRSLGSLRDLDLSTFRTVDDRLPPTLRARARHVLTENERVLSGVEALTQGKIERFGQLMNQSHRSLRDDFQVSTPELDLLVALSQKQQGVIGSRLTGAGFGGCTVSLVETHALADFRERVLEPYERETGLKPAQIVTPACDGASLIRLRPS